jgi:release factor glutamine methyltransferase
MGTGCGILAVVTAEMAARVVAVDINPYAVVCTKKNADLNGLRPKIEVLLGDLFSPLDSSRKFDLILFNSPYLPVEEDEGGSWIEKAWAGGETGRKIIDRFIEEVPEHISQEGRILLVQSNLSNVRTTLDFLDQSKLQAAVVDKEKLDFEEIVLIEAKKQPEGACT